LKAVSSLTVWLGAANVFQLVLGLGRVKLLAHWLGVTGFGELASLLAVVTIADAISQAGLAQVLMRDVAAKPAREGRIFGAALAIRLTLTMAVGLFLLLRGGTGPWGFLLVIALSGQLGVFTLRAKLLRAPQIIAGLLPGVTSLAAVGLCATLLPPSALSALAAVAVGTLIAASGQLGLAFRHLTSRLRVRGPEVLHLIGQAWPLWAGGVAVALYYRLSVLMLEGLMPPETRYAAIGYYQVAYTLIESGNAVLGALVMTAFPVFSSLHAVSPGRLKGAVIRSLGAAIFAGASACVVTVLLGEYAIRLVSNPKFLPALPALRILSLALILVPLNSLLGSLLIAVGRQKTYLFIILSQLAVNAAANWIIIPSFGFTGAAGVSVLTEATGLVLLLWQSRWLAVKNGKPS
jgi:O-antigen/teichoic acid export membrane protein